MAEKATTKLTRLEKQEVKLTKDLSKLQAKQREVEEKYRADHEAFMEEERQLREEIDDVSAQLPELRQLVAEEDGDE